MGEAVLGTSPLSGHHRLFAASVVLNTRRREWGPSIRVTKPIVAVFMDRRWVASMHQMVFASSILLTSSKRNEILSMRTYFLIAPSAKCIRIINSRRPEFEGYVYFDLARKNIFEDFFPKRSKKRSEFTPNRWVKRNVIQCRWPRKLGDQLRSKNVITWKGRPIKQEPALKV